MNKIKREYAYRTTDGQTYAGKRAFERAKTHQKRVDFRKKLDDLMPEIEKIFKLEDIYAGTGGDKDETELLDIINNEFSFEADHIDEWIRRMVDFYIQVPSVVKFFEFIESKFKNFK